MNSIDKYPTLIQFESFARFRNVLSFTTTRKGGFSSGTYDSFNLSYFSGDDPETVDKNRALLCEALSVSTDKLFVPFQTHQTDFCVINRDFISLSKAEQAQRLRGKDALITDCKGIAIAVTTADCVPIVVYAADKGIAAAVHAGWRGTCGKIIEKVVSCMVNEMDCSPEKMHAAIGPSISAESFEVGEEVVSAFQDNNFELKNISFRHPVTGKAHIDLWKANRQLMEKTGIPSLQIQEAAICTFKREEAFFSARKAGIASGRMLTGIVLS